MLTEISFQFVLEDEMIDNFVNKRTVQYQPVASLMEEES